MKKLLLISLLIGLVGVAGTIAVKHRFYISASAETETTFFKLFDLKSQIKPYVRKHSLSWSSDGGKSGWRTALHVREFHENFVVKPEERILLTASLKEILAAQLSVNGTRVIRAIGDAQTAFGFDYAEGNTLGTVMVYATQLGTECLHCASGASDEEATMLDVSIQEERYDAKPNAAMIEKFVKDRAFEKTASQGEDTSLAASLSRSMNSHDVSCANALRARLLEKGITVFPDPKDPQQFAINYPEGYFNK
jgi:hypothetical protein